MCSEYATATRSAAVSERRGSRLLLNFCKLMQRRLYGVTSQGIRLLQDCCILWKGQRDFIKWNTHFISLADTFVSLILALFCCKLQCIVAMIRTSHTMHIHLLLNERLCNYFILLYTRVNGRMVTVYCTTSSVCITSTTSPSWEMEHPLRFPRNSHHYVDTEETSPSSQKPHLPYPGVYKSS